jgi:hypothetical protein
MQQTIATTPEVAEELTIEAVTPLERRAARRRARRLGRARARAMGFRLFTLLAVLLLARAAAPTWRDSLQADAYVATSGMGWDLTGWVANALGEKVSEAIERPAAGYSEAEGALFVRGFMDRAQEIRSLVREVERLAAEGADPSAHAPLAADLAALRVQQEAERPLAEALIEAQVSSVLAEFGIGVAGRPWPPVLFTFTESPAKLVVSPRDRIGQAAYRMVEPGLPLEQLSTAEAELEAAAQEGGGVSAYIAPTGGLGAFPTLVVNTGNLDWVLSTVAHEWVHTYLAFFPLGFNYGRDPDNVTINETVADVVGEEVGRRVLERYYPELVPPPSPDAEQTTSELLPPDTPPAFDYRAEMRHTRETLDKFLAMGRVEDAERYLELRRLLFVENGFPIRKLNQAWFAFHGSYGTGPAASVEPDALGPLVQQVRAQQPDVASFLRAIRSVTDRAGVERLVAETSGE